METLQDVLRGSTHKEVDYVQYFIFFPPGQTNEETVSKLQNQRIVITDFIQPWIRDYLWQKDRFSLSIGYDDRNDPAYPFLYGVTRFGDCVNDQWFIIYLLREISKKLPETVISVADNDGEILLIEAALELPEWLDPMTSRNRVFIHQGLVHIIPLPSTPADIIEIPIAGKLQRQRAIELVRQQRVHTQADPPVQEAILERIREYPQAAQTERHRSRCILPKQAAFVLLKEPQLLPLAVEAFYIRDPLSLKACATMRQFPPANHNLVSTITTFTRTTFAQTVSQKFYPPKPFHLPPVSQKKQHRAAELGMKLACGLEMLYANNWDKTDDEDATSYAFDRDPKWKEYVANVTRLGYFQGERQGSRLYRERLERAKEEYLKQRRLPASVTYEDVDVDDINTFAGSLPFGSMSPRKKIDAILATYSEEELQQMLETHDSEESDSEDWMHVDPQQLEDLLNKRMKRMQESVMADMDREIDQEEKSTEVDLDKMVANFEQFIEGSRSGVEGVQFPGERDSDDEFSEENEEDDELYDENEDAAVSFNMEKFMSILKGVMDDVQIPLQQQQQQQPDEPEIRKEEASADTESKDTLRTMMDEMDEEIYSHDKITASFADGTSEGMEEREDAPVNVRLNLVKNVLESFKSQQGLPGPVGNILHQFGVVLPADEDQPEESASDRK
ncbi:SGT1 protein-domain-containing protein [Radiomyces spectabilis]|uniref:SGT1 protein-domain-containing protein n=1 Tax=Radiomyces spectabilis TaxID=64574 RepID=UPI00221E619D|nr:SGT1 protein-domain-containing protein [Radiomyces spectabilis]KAI8372944.1 SGT1 protein-domain-containing protein [Radiomyces spectabilis]